MRSVLVTRPQPVAEEFAAQLRAAGYAAPVAPMMEYVGLAAALDDLAEYQALIFTSAQGVLHFSARAASLPVAMSLPVLAVGDATAAAARAAGFTDVMSAKGNSAAVAALVREQAPRRGFKKILHPCSADTPDDISAALDGTGVTATRRPFYKAALTTAFPDAVAADLKAGKIDTVLLFSARTAQNFVDLLAKGDLTGQTKRLDIVCISKAVAAPLGALRWRRVRVAKKPRLDAVMQVLTALEKEGAADRRKRADRRVRAAKRDDDGHVISETYTGADRRTASRRAHKQQQKKRIWQEKMRFVNRSMLTAAFMFSAIVLAGVFLMAPEYARIDHAAPASKQAGASSGSGSLLDKVSGLVGQGINKVEGLVGGSSSTQQQQQPQTGYAQVLYNLSTLRRQDGEAAVSQAISRLHAALAAPDVQSPADITRTVDQQRRQSKEVDGLFGSLSGEDVAAGAMLLALNEFRSDVSNGRPYAADLATLQKFIGNDPRMNRALNHLAPYAETGVLNRRALQAELGGLAGDIVTAEMQGQDISVQQAAKKRFDRLVKAGNLAAIQGNSSAAVVARAQVMLDKGDVRGATQQLEMLQDPAAAADVQPWMRDATAYNIAGDASDNLTEGLLRDITTTGMGSVQDVMDEIKRGLGLVTNVPYVSPALTQGAHGGADVVTPKPIFP